MDFHDDYQRNTPASSDMRYISDLIKKVKIEQTFQLIPHIKNNS